MIAEVSLSPIEILSMDRSIRPIVRMHQSVTGVVVVMVTILLP